MSGRGCGGYTGAVMIPIVRATLLALLSAGSPLAADAQSPAPVLLSPPGIIYPPIARAAHVQGKVVVDFSIDSEGRTTSVRAVSGPVMLSSPLASRIADWRFQTPLPPAAETDCKATYTFDFAPDKLDLDDDLDAPPFVPCCGDSVSLMASTGELSGKVRSVSGGQEIDVSASAPAVEKDRCPEDHNRQMPAHTAPDDFVELERPYCNGSCSAYRVRVFRNGLIAWHGEKGNAGEGDRVAQIGFDASEELLARFATDSFWHGCSVELPSTLPDGDGDVPARIPALTVRMGGTQKTVNFSSFSFADDDTGPKLAWAVDRAADTHRWRHGDAASEPTDNMREDLLLPKSGITKLMRATRRFDPRTADLTLEPLKNFLAKGVDVEAADESGWTALMYAAAFDDSDSHSALALLLDAHASVDKASLHGDTALMAAAYNGDLSSLLLDHGAHINHANADGVTTLMLLASRRNREAIREALAHKADRNALDHAGRSALDYLRAAACGHPILALPGSGMSAVASDWTAPAMCPPEDEDYRGLVRLLTPDPQKP